MKEISTIELHFLEKELQTLVGAKVDKIFQPAKKELLLQLHKQGRILLHVLPNLIWITQKKQAMPKTLPSFCAFLRKKLGQARIKIIQQLKPERVLVFVFEKEETYRLVIELFSTGNVILCTNEGKILAASQTQVWKDRTVRSGEIYKLPKSQHNIFTINQDEFIQVFKDSKQNVSKTIATILGIGGLYAEELCIRAQIQPTKLDIAEEEGVRLYQALQGLLNQEPKPQIVIKDDKPIDLTPIPLEKYKLLKKKDCSSFNEAIDVVVSPKLGQTEKARTNKVYEKQLEKINKMIKMQQKNLKKLESEIKNNRQKGEYIYEQYQAINQIVMQIQELRKTLSWKEIKQKIPQIKEVDEATHSVILEI